MARLTQADLSDLNESFEERTPSELIHWAQEMFGTRLAALSSMQRAGCVVGHMMSQMKVDIPILFVDTGVLYS